MQYEIKYPGTNALLCVQLSQGESVRAESGAMVAKSHTVEIEGNLGGGMGKALKRSFLGGEKFFFQTLTAQSGPGEVLLAPSTLGDIKILDMTQEQDYMIQPGAYLASVGTVQIDTRMQKLQQGLFSGEGLFVLHAQGRGFVAVSSFGAVHEVSLAPEQEYVVDNGHLVAWSGDTSYRIAKASKGWISTFTSGEGLVCHFKGPGKVWIQTRNPQAFGEWASKFVGASGSRGGILSIFNLIE